MTTTTDRRATRVTKRLHHDRDFQRRFRRAPYRTLAEAGLGPSQVQAVLSGNARDLAAVGIDPEAVRRAPLRNRVRARVLTVISTVLALLGGPLLAAPASAARASFARFGRRFVRADARSIRLGKMSGARLGPRVVRRADRQLPGGPGECELQCVEVEVMP